jgi:hypothetical protein
MTVDDKIRQTICEAEWLCMSTNISTKSLFDSTTVQFRTMIET